MSAMPQTHPMHHELLSDIAVTRPGATRVLRRFGLDFCCHGRRPLADACREKGIDPDRVSSEIDATPHDEAPAAWAERPVNELIDFIVERYHEGLRRDLPEILQLAEDVDRAHAGHASRPVGLPDLVRTLQAELTDHMLKEERILFPLIKRGDGAEAGGPIHVMEAEHEDAGAMLARMRSLTSDLQAPADACPTWQALYQELDRLEQELMEHIHLENNVLFPRVLEA
jgi:regulator of cell morphogenesis and NO signaling